MIDGFVHLEAGIPTVQLKVFDGVLEFIVQQFLFPCFFRLKFLDSQLHLALDRLDIHVLLFYQLIGGDVGVFGILQAKRGAG